MIGLEYTKLSSAIILAAAGVACGALGCQGTTPSGGGGPRIIVTTQDSGAPSRDAGNGGGDGTVIGLDAGQDTGTGTHDTGAPAADPANGNDRCVSGSHWQGYSGYQMRPGDDCASCHRGAFAVAGTVYSQFHEETNCNGVPGVTIEIVDSSGHSQTIQSNSAGNFAASSYGTNIAMPYTAKVHYNGKTREMLTPQYSGDCGSCHTANGQSGAPGRIAIPY